MKWLAVSSCDVFSARTRKTEVSLKHELVYIVLHWILPELKAKSNTQRNTLKGRKLYCVQWKTESWCYGNTKLQLLQEGEWVKVNLIEEKRRQLSSMDPCKNQYGSGLVCVCPHRRDAQLRNMEEDMMLDCVLTWASCQAQTWTAPLACSGTRRGCWRSASSASLSPRSETDDVQTVTRGTSWNTNEGESLRQANVKSMLEGQRYFQLIFHHVDNHWWI